MYLRNLRAVSALADRSLSRRLGREEGLRLSAQIVDLHEAEDHVDERDQPEAERRVDPAGDLLRPAQHPAHVEVLRPQAGDRNVVTLEPGDRGVEDRLIAARVGDQRAADAAEAPDDEGSERQHDRDRDRHRDREREERGHAARCSQSCIGQTSAMMKRPRVSGAKTTSA